MATGPADAAGFPEPGQLLSKISSPADLRTLRVEQLPDLCQELREYIWDTIHRVGGHLGSSLGVVELTVVLHYLYDTPTDRILWDVGHQGYVHKVLTGRRDQLRTIRQWQGISGFLKRSESDYDVFGAGHASTAISAGLGVATARDLSKDKYRVVAVVGDGAMTGGLAYEGLNNAGASGRNLTVVLNDNAMSISPNVGAISRYLTNVISSPLFNRVKNEIWDFTEHMPKTQQVRQAARRVEESMKTLLTPGMLFEDLGFRYLGPINGHDTRQLISVFDKVRNLEGPILVHVHTHKGKGYERSESDPAKGHAVKAPSKKPSAAKVEMRKPGVSYTKAFADALTAQAAANPKVCAITAAMTDGTGLVDFAKTYPDRFFDVGIAEGHAVTFAAGMAAEGMIPVAAIYSTFLQRAYDHIIHDVAIQKLPVVFCLDRGGLVGADGPTHHGCFDLSYLGCIPGMVIAAPRNGTELAQLLKTAIEHREGPFAIRYPRDNVPEESVPTDVETLRIGSWEVVRPVAPVTFLGVGTMVATAEDAADRLLEDGIEAGVVNARFVKPLDTQVLEELANLSGIVITIEENAIQGGFGSQVTRWMEERGVLDRVRLYHFGIPDEFVEHGSRQQLLDACGLTASKIHERLQTALAPLPNQSAVPHDS